MIKTRERDIAFKRVDLASESVAPHRHIDPAQWQRLASSDTGVEDLAGQHDHPRARAIGRKPGSQSGTQRLKQIEPAQQVADGGGFATRNHQPIHRVEFAAAAHGHRLGAGFAQRRQVLAGIALQRQHPNPRNTHNPLTFRPADIRLGSGSALPA